MVSAMIEYICRVSTLIPAMPCDNGVNIAILPRNFIDKTGRTVYALRMYCILLATMNVYCVYGDEIITKYDTKCTMPGSIITCVELSQPKDLLLVFGTIVVRDCT